MKRLLVLPLLLAACAAPGTPEQERERHTVEAAAQVARDAGTLFGPAGDLAGGLLATGLLGAYAIYQKKTAPARHAKFSSAKQAPSVRHV